MNNKFLHMFMQHTAIGLSERPQFHRLYEVLSCEIYNTFNHRKITAQMLTRNECVKPLYVGPS